MARDAGQVARDAGVERSGAEARTVVVVEDDPHIADLVDMYLRRDGFRILLAVDGERGLQLVDQHRPDLVIVDIGLPGRLDGFELCRRLRSGGRADPSGGGVPVIMLSARGDEIDRVLGLELGADDYVTKPFSPRELVARVHAVLRRAMQPVGETHRQVLEVGAVHVDIGRHEVCRDGELVPLTPREFALLAHLVTHRGLVLTRRQLLDAVWGATWVGDERTVDVHVRQLRRKVGDELPLATVRNVGYRLG